MAYLLDGAVLVIFLLAIWIGHRRGFIKTVAGLVAFIAAAAVAMLLSGPVAQLAYDKAVEPSVVAAIDLHLTENVELQAGIDQALSEMPTFVTNALANSGIASSSDVIAKIGGGVEDVSTAIAQQVVLPVVLPLLKVIATLLLFILAYIVARILLTVLNVVAKLPVLKQINKSLGFLAGAVSGVLWVLFAVSALQVLAATGAADGVLNPSVLNETMLVSWLVTINPVGGMLRDVMAIIE